MRPKYKFKRVIFYKIFENRIDKEYTLIGDFYPNKMFDGLAILDYPFNTNMTLTEEADKMREIREAFHARGNKHG